MANDTTLTLIGNLTGDPELRYLPSGVAMVKFTIASTPRVLDKTSGQWVDAEALFLSCTAWRQLAENITESLTKGTRVVVTGRLGQRHWETEQGEKRSAYGLDVEEIGPSLRFATTKVTRTTRSTNNGNGAGAAAPVDEWATATPTAPVGAGSVEPPF
jgi:single-strand DNA-binding protein